MKGGTKQQGICFNFCRQSTGNLNGKRMKVEQGICFNSCQSTGNLNPAEVEAEDGRFFMLKHYGQIKICTCIREFFDKEIETYALRNSAR